MQRTFNYTGRKKIDKGEALFSFSGPEKSLSFDVEFRINEEGFPADAKLYVEAYYKETRQRYDFGYISRIAPPKDRSLSEIDLSGSTLFRVLVVDESGTRGLLLASGDGFRADKDINEDKDKSSLLAVTKKPLGQLTWRVDFNSGNAMPELYLNENIPNVIDKMKADPYFQSLILPAALREVLAYYLWNGYEDSEFAEKWMQFAELFGGDKPESDDPLELMNWVDDIVSEFSTKFNFCDRLVTYVSENV